ncbi:hypothetical protein, partial [Photorhabdus sp. P32]|uniref:hypothetical protein n=1 Tax=Photorhabdus sp. P32 TaxID=3117549 RepID=UPI004053C4E1
ITLPLITASVMEVFKFGFLFIGNEYFHDGYHEPHLGENQAVSMSTGIYLIDFELQRGGK